MNNTPVDCSTRYANATKLKRKITYNFDVLHKSTGIANTFQLCVLKDFSINCLIHNLSPEMEYSVESGLLICQLLSSMNKIKAKNDAEYRKKSE